ncbi:MAG: hypothetical protein WC981_00860 [Candidatus Dojkabacteria bacterium]
MAIRLTKTSKILFAIGIVVLSVALGFLIWRVNQPEQLDPGDSDAAGGECEEGATWYPADSTVNNYCIDDKWEKTFPAGCYVKGSCQGGIGWISKAPKSVVACYTTEAECKEAFKVQIAKCNETGKHGYCASGNCDFSKTGKYSGWIYQCSETPAPKPAVDCGLTLEPTSYPFNKANTDGSKIGPFTEDGKLVFFFKNLLDNNAAYRPKITFKVVSTDSSRNNQTYVYKPTAGEERKETTFAVKKGEYLLLTDSNDDYDQGSPECAPTTNNPKYKSFGWIAPSGGSCGSGLQGPPTNGTRTAYEKVSISSFRSNALTQGYKQLPKGEQCWADWREWVGDYDFNDYFLMVSYVTDAPTPTPNISISKAVVEQCIDENTANPKAELTYTITVKNTGGSAGDIDEIEDILDSKVLESFIQKETITKPGVYSDGKITWSGKKNIPANGSAIYTYKLLIDKENFGTYSNTVSLQEAFFCPVGQICAQVMPPLIYASAEIVADCVITETPETPVTPTEGTVPQTGIFDSTASRIVAGFVLLTFGAVIYNLPNSTFTVYKKGKSYKYRDRFEKRVANR